MTRDDGPVYAFGDVRQGKLRIRQSNLLAAQLATLRDGVVEITIARKKATRSHAQNAYYWVCLVGLVAEHCGYTPDEIHAIYKAKFLPKRLAVTDANGEIQGEFVVGGTTTRLSPAEFSDYCTRIQQWAEETLGVLIPVRFDREGAHATAEY